MIVRLTEGKLYRFFSDNHHANVIRKPGYFYASYKEILTHRRVDLALELSSRLSLCATHTHTHTHDQCPILRLVSNTLLKIGPARLTHQLRKENDHQHQIKQIVGLEALSMDARVRKGGL